MNIILKIKSVIKKNVPSFIMRYVVKRRFDNLSKMCYNYDADRFIRHSNAYYSWDNPDKLIGQIVAEYHVIEKGLAMIDMRLGFGEKVLNDLLDHCMLFIKRFNSNNSQLIHALKVISEYKSVHTKENYTLSEEIDIKINQLFSNVKGIEPSQQIQMIKSEYFKEIHSSFEKFSGSRHSLRNFKGKVDVDDIKKAINLAQSAPSACNRQPSRVYIVQDKEKIQQVLSVQSGNRGFGHLADKLLIITGELGGFLSLHERNDVYVNGGIFIMNLLYSLHYYQIGACSLNWCVMPEQDMSLRNICNIKPSETVIMIIACGGVPEEFKIVTSPRSCFTEIIRIV